MWCHPVAKFATYASGAIWWSNLQLMQVVPSGGQICNSCKWRHLVAKFVTDASGATWWLLEPMQVAFFLLAGEITQVKDSIPWVRCASGNVFLLRLICRGAGLPLHCASKDLDQDTKAEWEKVLSLGSPELCDIT